MVEDAVAVLVGVVLGVVSVLGARAARTERWSYGAALVVLPLVYVGFGLAAGEPGAALDELVVGVPFLLLAVVCGLSGRTWGVRLAGLAWLAHGLFDVVHDDLVTNPGVPGWYPAACIGTDLVIGAYVVWAAPRIAGRTSAASA